MAQQISKWFPFKRGERSVRPTNVEVPSVLGSSMLKPSMREAMEHFFGDDWLTRSPLVEGAFFGDFSPHEFVPSVDIADEKKEIKITAELPGLAREDVEIDVRDNRLLLRGEKRYYEESSEVGFYRTERAFGMFQRSIPLPVEVDVDKADAQMKNGVLIVRLPKTGKSDGAKRIPIHN